MEHTAQTLREAGTAHAVACDIACVDEDAIFEACEADPQITLFLAMSGLGVDQVSDALRTLEARRAIMRGRDFTTTLAADLSGEEVWTQICLNARAAGWRLHLKDVTALVAVEMSLQPANIDRAPPKAPALDDVIRDLGTGIVLVPADGPFGRLNEAAQRLLGVRTLTEARRQLDLLAGDVFSAPATRVAVRADADGRAVTLAIAANPLVLQGRQFSLVTVTDISGQFETSPGTEEVTATVTHELRTPLASLIGSLDLLSNDLKDDPGDRVRTLLDMSRRNAERLSALVDDLALAQETDRDRLGIASEPLLAADVLAEALDANTGLAAHYGVRLCLFSQLGEERVEADPVRLQQVLGNLISNAVKYSNGSTRVHLYAARVGGELRISVRDTGLGIPKGDLAHIFGRYYRVDNADHMRVSGTGLGLAISQDLVERMDGRIEVASRTGVRSGSTFTVCLPLVDAVQAAGQHA